MTIAKVSQYSVWIFFFKEMKWSCGICSKDRELQSVVLVFQMAESTFIHSERESTWLWRWLRSCTSVLCGDSCSYLSLFLPILLPLLTYLLGWGSRDGCRCLSREGKQEDSSYVMTRTSGLKSELWVQIPFHPVLCCATQRKHFVLSLSLTLFVHSGDKNPLLPRQWWKLNSLMDLSNVYGASTIYIYRYIDRYQIQIQPYVRHCRQNNGEDNTIHGLISRSFQ